MLSEGLYLRHVPSRFLAVLALPTARHDYDNVSYEPHPDTEQSMGNATETCPCIRLIAKPFQPLRSQAVLLCPLPIGNVVELSAVRFGWSSIERLGAR